MTTRHIAWRSASAAALALAAAPAPALAQDFCGGLSANGQWVGGTEAASDIATAGAYLEQMALVLQDNRYVALFSASAPTDVRLEAQARGAGDPLVELHDESGAVVGSDDDSGGDGAARLETTVQPGRYCLVMTSYGGEPMTGFVRVGRTDQEALTTGMDAAPTDPTIPTDPGMPADTGSYGGPCMAASVTRNLAEGPLDQALAAGPVSQTASVAEVPVWGFSLAQPATISITAQNDAADPTIGLYGQDGTWWAENDDWDGLSSRIDQATPLPAGDYCLSMNALSDTTQPITVTVTAYDAAAAQRGMYDRGEAAPPLDGSYPVTALGPLATRLRADVPVQDVTAWYSLEVPEGGLLLAEAVANGQSDPSLLLFDDLGRQIAVNYDNGQTADALLAARVAPGTYILGVQQYAQGGPGLVRLVVERYVPAR